MHRHPPDVDWRAVERANGLASIARRNAIGGRRPVDAWGARWVERGSDNQAGRVMTAARSSDGSGLVVGSALGGVWRGTLAGDDWTPIGDNLYGGAAWLAVFPSATPGGPDVIVAATDGGLVHRTTDDGVTWLVPTGVGNPWEVRRLVVASDGSGRAFMVVRPGFAGGSKVLRSVDRGASWVEVHDAGSYDADLWTPRDGGSAVFLLAENHQVRRSDDGGDTWTVVGAIPGGGPRGAELVGSEAGAPRLWAAVDDTDGQRVWVSDDAGATWTAREALTDYWGALEASIVDVDRFAWGGVEVHRTTDGGQTFEVVNDWSEYYGDPQGKLHADIMGMVVVPDGAGERWYVGTDGGLYESRDGLMSVENLSLRGLRVGQYYDVLTNVENPDDVAVGAQDQGYQLTNGIAQDGDRWDFEQVLSGDYGHLTSSDGSHDWVYSVYPGFMLVQEGAEAPVLHYADFPSDTAYGWLPTVVADPDKKRSVFFAGTRLWRGSWDADAGRVTWEQWSDQAFGAGGYEYMSGLAFSPIDSELAWAANSYGRLFRSTDHGVSWTESADIGPGPHYFYGTTVLPSITDPDLVWVGGSGYGSPAVRRSRDGGATWKAFSEGLPDTLVYALCEAPDGSGTLFAATETGAWRRDKGADAVWEDISGAEAPLTLYWSCEALQHENTIRFATYGRGLWDYQLDPLGVGCFPPVDRDGDGALCDVDCDDANPEVYPGANEVQCDGVDQNCLPDELPDDACAIVRPEAEGRACGCDGSPAVPGAAVGALALLAVRRRRQGR